MEKTTTRDSGITPRSMRSRTIGESRHSIRQLAVLGLTVWAIALGAICAEAVSVNVNIDASQAWNGFENVYYRNGGFWTNTAFAPGTAGVIQGSINSTGTVTCEPDIRMDRDFHFDTNAWADASGTSTGICRVVSTFYVDSTSIAHAADTVIFSGSLVSNTLAPAYASNIVAFIKDYDSTWASYGMASVNLNTLTNGQPFAISKTIAAPGAGNHVQYGFEWSGPPARTNSVSGLGRVVLAPLPPAPGANVPWTTYEAENMVINGGTILGPEYLPNLVTSESSGRRCVQLSAAGQYVELAAQAAANALVVRYSVPDSPDGVGADYTLSLYKNGSFVQKLAVTSRYSWLYGAYPFTNNPAAGSPRDFYDEVRVLGLTVNSGDTLRLEKDANDTAAYYIIDLVDLENVAAALSAPTNSLAITSYGGVGDGVTDCTAALQNCINAAQGQGKTAWMPTGTYLITGNINLPSGTTLQGAGMWYTKLIGSASLNNTTPSRRINLNGAGTNIHLSDFAILGFLNYRNDSEGNDGLGGFYGTNSTISRIWVEHTKAAAWIQNSLGLVVDSCRFRNTLADGINVNVGMRATIVTNCTARGTGDDGFAIWPAPNPPTFVPGLNVITHCTAQTPFLANGGAIYGGDSNRIEDCLFQDTPYGCGILIATSFPVGAPFRGTTVAQRCDLIRCGGDDSGWHGWRAALQICLDAYSGIPGVLLSQLNISNSISDGLSIIGNAGALTNAVAFNISIPDYGLGVRGRNGLWARSDAIGSMTFSNSTIVEFSNDSSGFLFNFVPPLPPRFLNITAGGAVTLKYATCPGMAYHVESTTNLSPVSWTTVPGSTTNAPGNSVTFTAPLAPGSGPRFYRTVSP